MSAALSSARWSRVALGRFLRGFRAVFLRYRDGHFGNRDVVGQAEVFLVQLAVLLEVLALELQLAGLHHQLLHLGRDVVRPRRQLGFGQRVFHLGLLVPPRLLRRRLLGLLRPGVRLLERLDRFELLVRLGVGIAERRTPVAGCFGVVGLRRRQFVHGGLELAREIGCRLLIDGVVCIDLLRADVWTTLCALLDL